MIPLNEVACVLLDMDGTLLDKYFDDYFWEHLVPEKYSEKHRVSFGKAKEVLMALYKAHERTLNWTDIDFWSQELRLDIPALKEQIQHLIEVHPHVVDFLREMRRRDKKVYMVTNAHYKVLGLKMRKTRLGRYFDRCITSNELGYPKELIEFWHRLEKEIDFDKERTLFIDDTEDILKTARDYGIRYLLYKSHANSKRESLISHEFPMIKDFSELLRAVCS